MNSAEVQRTLVKSRPELWAELSDPAALARHLGELGEIHISRIEPEHKVEWEAEDTRGTVLLHPSGWGTKVVLTVSRKSSEPGSPPSTDLLDAAGATEQSQPRPFTSHELAAEPTLGAEADTPTDEFEALADAELEPMADAELEPMADAELESMPDAELESMPDGELEPMPDGELEPMADAELEPVADGDFEPAAKALEPSPEAALEPMIDAEHAPEAESRPHLEGRRGFFARLFRRRRRQEAAEHEPEPIEDAQPWRAWPESAQAPTVIAEPEIARALSELAHTLDEVGDGPRIAPETEPATAPELPTEPAIASEAVLAPEAGATPEPEVAAEPQLGQEPEAAPVPEVGKRSAVHAEIATQPATAADAEDGEDRVTAVLTSVLDRLGAAHHRPFSRA